MNRKIILVVFLLVSVEALAQTNNRVVQLSGFITSRDSTEGPLQGAYVTIPKAGRGEVTNHAGFFTIPVLISDSVIFSMVGYKRRHYIVPANARDYETVFVEMVEDTTYLRPIEITSIPTEEMFKEAILALNVPMDENGMDKRNLNAELLALMLKTPAPMDASANFRNYIDQWSNSPRDAFQPRVNPFLNPFNWARFIRDLRGGKKKRK